MFGGRSVDPEGDHLVHRARVLSFWWPPEHHRVQLFTWQTLLRRGDYVFIILSSFCFSVVLLFKPDGCVLRPSSSAACARCLCQRDSDEQHDSETWKTSSFLNPSSDSFLLLSIHHSYSKPVSFSDDAGSLFKVKRSLRHVQEFAIKSELFKLCSDTWIPQICGDLLSFLAPFHSHLHLVLSIFECWSDKMPPASQFQETAWVLH